MLDTPPSPLPAFSTSRLKSQPKGQSLPLHLTAARVLRAVCNPGEGVPGAGRETLPWGIPRGFCLRKNHRVGAMQVSKAAPRAEAQAEGQVTALNGLSPPQTSGRLSPVPPPPRRVRCGPHPSPAAEAGFPAVRALPPPQPQRTRATGEQGGGEIRGARAREGSLPVAATHLVAEHSWGGGKGAGRGVGGGREKKRRLPGLLGARGSPTGSRPLAAAVRRSVRGDVRRRASGWAGSPAAAAARGQIWRLASLCERRERDP